MQVKSEFVAILREGWLQFRKEPRSLLKSWKVGWFELLADGKLAWYPSPSKKPHETRYPALAGAFACAMLDLCCCHSWM